MTTPLRLPDAFTQGRTRAAAATPTCCCCCCCAVSVAATSVALPMGFLADTADTAGTPPERDRSARRFVATGLALLPAAVVLTAFALARESLAGGLVLVVSIFGGLIAVGVVSTIGGSGAQVNGIMRYLCGVLAVMVELFLSLPLLGMLAALPEPLAVTLYLAVAAAVAVLIARIYARRLRR